MPREAQRGHCTGKESQRSGLLPPHRKVKWESTASFLLSRALSVVEKMCQWLSLISAIANKSPISGMNPSSPQYPTPGCHKRIHPCMLVRVTALTSMTCLICVARGSPGSPNPSHIHILFPLSPLASLEHLSKPYLSHLLNGYP